MTLVINQSESEKIQKCIGEGNQLNSTLGLLIGYVKALDNIRNGMKESTVLLNSSNMYSLLIMIHYHLSNSLKL